MYFVIKSKREALNCVADRLMAATEKDIETAEFVSSLVADDANDSGSEYDNETGELDATKTSSKQRKTANFSILKNLTALQDDPNKCCIDPNDTFTLSKKEQVITLQEEIILGCNKTSNRLFLIVASLLFFTSIVAVLATLIVVMMHIWAHKKNCRNSNPNIYYRSPVHIFTSQFCIVCQHESSMDQVINLQDQRNKLWRLNLMNVAKNIY